MKHEHLNFLCFCFTGNFYILIQIIKKIKAMKKILTLVTGILFSLIVFTQTPQTINYQAVARNNSGQALVNQAIKVRLSIVKNNITQYSETRSVTTNALGLFNISIGSAGATNVIGTLLGADWYYTQAEPVKLKVEIDVSNGNTFTDMGSQDLSTVPYSMLSSIAMQTLTLQGYPVSSTAPQAGDLLQWTGSNWKPKKGPQTFAISGAIAGNIPSGESAYSFRGPTVTVTVDGTQTISGAVTASLGTSTAGGAVALFNLGYQNTAGGSVTTFSTVSNDNLFTTRNSVTAANSVVLPAGTYVIGFVVRNTSTITLNLNGNVTGFISVY